jgi:DNA-binding NarL/FixJ family response regulator
VKLKAMLKFVVVDDEPLALEILDGYLKKMGDVHTVSSFNNAGDALHYFENNKADI